MCSCITLSIDSNQILDVELWANLYKEQMSLKLSRIKNITQYLVLTFTKPQTTMCWHIPCKLVQTTLLNSQQDETNLQIVKAKQNFLRFIWNLCFFICLPPFLCSFWNLFVLHCLCYTLVTYTCSCLLSCRYNLQERFC